MFYLSKKFVYTVKGKWQHRISKKCVSACCGGNNRKYKKIA